MKILFILRHAKSSWKDDSMADHERPLNKRGEGDAPFMGELMKEHGLLPELVLCSTAVRARETAKLALEAADYPGEIRLSDELYAFEPGPYLNALTSLEDTFKKVMLVGHNPAMEELLTGLTGEHESLPTASLAQIRLPIEHWNEVSFGMHAQVENIWRPKEERKK